MIIDLFGTWLLQNIGYPKGRRSNDPASFLIPNRFWIICLAALTIAGCNDRVSRNLGEREVSRNRAAAFHSLIEETGNTSRFTKVSIDKGTRYESEMSRADPRWSSTVGGEMRFAQSYKVVVEVNEPTDMIATQRFNGDELVSSVRLTLEDLDGSRTRIRYEITPARGPRAEDFGEFLDSCQLAGTLASLGKLSPSTSAAEKAEESAALDRCTKAGEALSAAG